jgi:hypothetical protein
LGTQWKTAEITAGAEKKRLRAATENVTKELLKLLASEPVVDVAISVRMRDDRRRAVTCYSKDSG